MKKNQQTFSHPCNHLCYGYGDSRLKTPQSDSSTLLVSYRYGTIGVSGSNVIFGASGASWFASGTPEFPLSTTNVDINPYL